MRSLVYLALVVPLAFGQEFAQTGALRFEVASLKPTPPGEQGEALRPQPGGLRYSAKGTSLRAYLWVAYQVKPDRISGGPGWLDTDQYDLNGEAAKPSRIEDLHIMLQNLLTERMKLKFHFEKKDMSAYVLTVDKDGPKNLTRHDQRNSGDASIVQFTEGLVHAKWKLTSNSMAVLAWRLGNILDRPVIDETGLQGDYDFELSYTMDLPPGIKEGQMFNGTPIEADGPTIYQALPKQLGLKLEGKRAPVQIMVIDHAERPGAD